MHGKILQRQAKTRSGIFQVVHEKRRHGLEGLQFFRQHQLLRQSKVQQDCGDLIPNALERSSSSMV